jgi:Ca2+-binding EF-hand superfamily protein
MTLNKREQQEKDLKAILAKDIGSKNPVFSTEFIADLHEMFSLYADPRQRRADIRDILMTAKNLGLDSKNELVFRALVDIGEGTGGDALDFETFLR